MRHFFSSLILFVAIASATLSTSSCSNDEDNKKNAKPSQGVIETKADSTNTENKADTTNYVSISMDEKDGIIMTLCLLNSAGDSTVTFCEGEEIIFDLKIENTTDEHISIPGGPWTLGYDTFRVYTVEGEDCGVSWTYIEDWTEEMSYLWPFTTYHYQCPWYSDSVMKATYPFIFKPSQKELIKGCYYTEAYCHINDETTLYCKIHFTIK